MSGYKMDPIRIRKGKNKDVVEASDLVYNTFKKFNTGEGTSEGVKNYLKIHDNLRNPDLIKRNYEKSKIFFVAEKNNKIIGVIRGNESRIFNLFIDGKYHKKGLAGKLLERFEKEAKKLGSEKIKVRASLYSRGFYQKKGYKKSTGLKEMKGLKFQPMIKKFDSK